MINTEKSKTMIFNESGKILKNYTFHVGGAKMELVQNFCYLGLDITASGSFHIAKSNLKDKGIKAMSRANNRQFPLTMFLMRSNNNSYAYLF